ncbi:MAG: ATP-binding cassette domain-containing protein [Candidatus Competibacteraceae bacterium]|nr:ATP-binding cassette domain-containing protein [Candidatus Competibacteraceae bacterium]MBK8961628.1 ATP-binding cassette domain-containing protein [Candidatus Competibacteraceae bacterium]MBK9950850.1 ATP-binding cassette domain-containing protein [Candidatus Competibacteraceae bacterium]
MLTLRQLSLQRGGKPLFDNTSLTVYPGWKVGLIGANGSGKSSLFALLLDELHQDSGDLDRPPRWVVAHVAQETPALTVPALEYVLDGDAELRRIERELHAAEAAHDGARQADCHARFEAIDGYSARARAGKLMNGLGFAPDRLERPAAEFSGGWRVRLNLARALMCRSDLLLLDEPTNHLDLDAVLWLEQWLRAYPGTLLIISHDRDVLDNVVDRIAHIDQCRITLYAGNYAAFEEQRAARLALQQAAYEKQQREIAHLESFITRFRAKATKARQAQSRIKALERMERIAAAHVDSPFEFQFAEPGRLPNPLLAVEKVAAGYGERRVLEQVKLTLHPGTRLGLLGPNGAGKSTLIKLLAGVLPPLSGRIETGQGLAIGYFAQHQLEQLRPDWSALRHLQQLGDRATEQQLRDFIGGFGFNGDRALEPVAPFSGGEKARLALALLVWQRPNLLLLDEPTNHLDLDMRHALTLALQDYQGALIVVSHDRHLLRTVTDEFLLVADGRAQPFDGDLDDYRDWINERQRTASREAESRTTGNSNSALERREQKRQDAERRQQQAIKRRPLEQRIKKLEQQLETLHAEQSRLHDDLLEPALYEDANKTPLKALLLRKAQADKALEEIESDWLEAQEALEALARLE